jgi:hypothetical protein
VDGDNESVVFGHKYCIKVRMVKELVRNQVVCRVFSYLLVTFPLLNSRGILKKVELAQVKQGNYYLVEAITASSRTTTFHRICARHPLRMRGSLIPILCLNNCGTLHQLFKKQNY